MKSRRIAQRVTLAAGIVLSLSAITSACGTDKAVVETNGAANETAEPQSDRLDQTIRSSDAIGVTLSPPAATDKPTISSEEAVVAAVKVFGADSLKGMTAKLAILNDRATGDIQKDGSVERTYVDRLVWALIGYNTCAPLSESLTGGVPNEAPDGETRHAPTTLVPITCVGVITVDANTGQYLMGYTAAKDAYEDEQRGIRNIQEQQSTSTKP